MATSTSSVTQYPRAVTLSLTLEMEIPDEERDSYIFAAPAEEHEILQIGFIADLFDLFNFDSDLGVLRINGFTHAQITKTLQNTL